MSPTTAAKPSARTPAEQPAVREAIDAILAELASAQSRLTGARPATAAGKETLDAAIARFTAMRGRGLTYRYVGSGLGNGPLVELLDGSVKWDMIGGIGVHPFGHGDPGMVRIALESALSDLLQQGNLQFNEDSIAFGEFLVAEASRATGLRHCFVSNSGCMVNEAALKICQQKTAGAPRVLAFDDCFMGRSTTMTQLGDGPAYRQGVALNAQVDYLPFYDTLEGDASTEATLRLLRRFIARYPKQHACLVMELVQGEGGFNTAPRTFLRGVMETARAAGIPVWVDEIQTFGRTEQMFHCEQAGVGDLVDVLTLGKLSQACACLYTPQLNPAAGLLSGTFSASTAAFRCGLAGLKRLKDGGYGPQGRHAALFAAFRTQVEGLAKRVPQCFGPVRDDRGRVTTEIVGGVGGMMRFTPFGGDKDRIGKALQAMFEEGVIAFSCGHGPYHIRFLPPIGVLRAEHLGPVFEIVERALLRVA